MASPSATTATPEFPSFETLFDAAGHAKPGEAIAFPVVSLTVDRLRWSLNGPLETSISVMAHRKISPDLPPDEPYYQPTLSGNGTAGRSSGSWHPISQESLVEPKVSSIIVQVNELDLWEEYWLQAHEGHYYPDYPVTGINVDPAQTRIGPLPGAPPDDPTGGWHSDLGLYPDENGEDTWHLLKCCGVERPLDSAERFKFIVEAKGERGFLTIHDYIEQVHHRLMGWREEILEATALALECLGDASAFRPEKLMVDSVTGRYIHILDEKEWMRRHKQW